MSVPNTVPSAPIGQEEFPLGSPRLVISHRLFFLAIGIVLVVLLAIAAWLTPSPRGMGTHHQLGLPPCSFVIWFGMRCPACGMTTSWSHVMHGHLLQAFATNAGGTLLALTSIVWVPWLFGTALWGRFLWSPPAVEWIAAWSAGIGLITLVEWGVRIYFR